MPKTAEDLQKQTLNFRRGDWEKLAELYPDIPTSVVVRRIVSNIVDNFDQGQQLVRLEEIHL